MLLYKGRFYVCGCGLGTSLADCSGRRVHKVDPYMVVCMGQFYVLHIRLTLIVKGSVVHKIDPLYIKVNLNTEEPTYIRLTLIV